MISMPVRDVDGRKTFAKALYPIRKRYCLCNGQRRIDKNRIFLTGDER